MYIVALNKGDIIRSTARDSHDSQRIATPNLGFSTSKRHVDLICLLDILDQHYVYIYHG